MDKQKKIPVVWCSNQGAPCQVAADARREIDMVRDEIKRGVLVAGALGAAGGSAVMDVLRALFS